LMSTRLVLLKMLRKSGINANCSTVTPLLSRKNIRNWAIPGRFSSNSFHLFFIALNKIIYLLLKQLWHRGPADQTRSEERRVGKEWRCRWETSRCTKKESRG